MEDVGEPDEPEPELNSLPENIRLATSWSDNESDREVSETEFRGSEELVGTALVAFAAFDDSE